ncbi:uncharacterized protein METZ01_LOCUS196691, partial [marine metagenome]
VAATGATISVVLFVITADSDSVNLG